MHQNAVIRHEDNSYLDKLIRKKQKFCKAAAAKDDSAMGAGMLSSLIYTN